MQRPFENQPAQITFTSDYHELVEGDLRPGRPVTLRYDPDRLKPPAEYTFGDDSHPIHAQAKYRMGDEITSVPLRGPRILHPDRDPTGQGSMLTGRLEVPDDADHLELWVHGEMPDGARWDSDDGRNFWFRFPYLDLPSVSARVEKASDASAVFTLEVTARPYVGGVRVRSRDMASRDPVTQEQDLAESGAAREDRLWRLQAPAAAGAVIRFKLYYRVAERWYKDDNSSRYYLAERDDARVAVPPPPAALADAVDKWSARVSDRTKE